MDRALGTTWSNTTAWFAGMAPPNNGSTTTVLQFNNTLALSYTATNDLGSTPGPFQLQGIVFNSSSSVAPTIANAVSNTLQFAGASPFVTQSGFGAFTVTAAFSLNPTSGDFTVNGSGLGAATFSGIISESGARTLVLNTSPSVLNAQVIALTGANTFTGGIRLMSGNLALGTNNAAPGTGAITIEGGSLQLTTGIVVSNSVTLTSTMNFIGATSGTFSGVLSGGGGVTVAGTGAAVGLNLTGANTYSGITTVDHGRIGTPNGRINPGTISILGAGGALANTSELRIRSSGTVNLGDTVTGGGGGDRINNAAAVTMGGGYLNLTSTSSTSYSETMGVLTAEAGHSAITLIPGTSAMAQMTFSSLARGADRGTLFFRGNLFGDTPASNKVNIFFTTPPTIANGLQAGGGIGAGFDGTPNVAMIPFAFADRTNAGSGGDSSVGSVGFVTYDAARGVRLLDHGTEYAVGFGAVTGTTNNLLLTASSNPGAPISINSLFARHASGTPVTVGTVGDTNTISFPTGNAAAIYSTGGSLTINTPLSFNGNEGIFIARTTMMIVNGVISGTNGITKLGAGGSLSLTAANTYSGTTTVNSGTLTFANVSALGTSNQFILGGGVTGTTGTVGQAILQYTGASPATLTQDIKLSSGLPEIRSSTSTATLTLSGTISGPGGLYFNSPGNVVLTGSNSYTGQTRIFGGNIVISSDANLGSGGAIDIGASSTTGLILNGDWTTSRQVNMSFTSQLNTQGFNATLNGPLTGTSGLNKAGAGKLTLNTANPNSGVVTINAGVLEVNGSLGPSASGVTIASGASVAGTGTIYRTVTVSSGGIVAPGTSVGVLTANALSLTTATLNWESNGTIFDRMDLIGALTLTGTSLMNLSGPQVPVGAYTLMNFASVTGTGIGLGTNLGGSFKYLLALNPTNLTLNVSPLTEYEWAPGGLNSDGAGNWTQGGAGWQVGGSLVNYTTTDDNANFGHGGTPGIVTLTNPVSALNIKFQSVSSGSYEIAQGTGALTVLSGIDATNADGLISAGIAMGSSNTMTVGTGRTLDLNGAISGTGFGLTKAGSGLLRLGAANTYTGGTTVNGGELRLNAVGAYPAGTPLTVNSGGTFTLNGFNASATTLTGTGRVNLASTLTLTGGSQTVAAQLDGNGVISFATGVLTLTGSNGGWSGGLNTTGTGLSVTSPANLGTGPISVTNATSAHTATIALANGTSATFTNPIMLSIGGTQTLFTTGAATNTNVTLSGLISGTAGTSTIEALKFTGSSADSNFFILTNPANSFTGNIRIDEGGLAITSNGALGAAGNSIDIFNINAAAGGLRFDANGINMTHNVTLQSTSFINTNGNSATVSGVISLSGALNIGGGGVLTLSGANTYTGATNVNTGTLRVTGTHGATAGAYTIAAGARLGGTGVVTLASGAAVTINGTVAPGASVGSLTLTTAGAGSTVFAGGGSYDFEIDDAIGTSGVSPGWDRLNLTALNVTATSGTPFMVKIFALPGGGGPELDNFNPDTPYSWIIANASAGITGFDLTKFTIETTNFENNNTNKGGFYVSVSGGDLMLNYVPEPSTGLLALAGAVGLLRRRRRERIVAAR